MQLNAATADKGGGTVKVNKMGTRFSSDTDDINATPMEGEARAALPHLRARLPQMLSRAGDHRWHHRRRPQATGGCGSCGRT